jgi:hypothetical protein
VGPWKPVKPGDILSAGQFNVRFNAEGTAFSLDEVPQAGSEPPRSGPIPNEGFPSSFRPSPTSGFREAQADMTQLPQGKVPVFLGDSRSLLVTRKKEDPGLYYSNPDQPLNGEYYLNLGAGGLLKFFDKDLFSLERLEGERYKLTNIGAKNFLMITNDRGAERKVSVGGVDQAVAGDTIVLDNGKMKIELNK